MSFNPEAGLSHSVSKKLDKQESSAPNAPSLL